MSGIEDVAREAGVSTATVSRALRGLPNVSPGTRMRVLEVAGRLGYVASPHAASLAGGRTRTVAVVIPFVTRWFFATVVHGAEQTLREADYDLLLYNLAGDPAARHRVFGTQLLRKRVDALLILALSPTDVEVEWIKGLGLPVVTVGSEVDCWASVRIDDEAAARTAVEHLVGLGHRAIGYIGGELHDVLDFAAPLGRLSGYREAMTAAGLSYDEGLVVAGDFTVAGGVRAAERLLEVPDPPTAIFAASDEMAIGALWAVRQAGLRVPEDVSVVGIDGHEMASYFELTTVEQPVHEQGTIAAEQVLAALTVPRDAIRPIRHQVVPTELVVRGSTGPPRR